ncbi:MAG: metallophosphoesterase family protein [Bacteroidales bacterium]
MGRLIAIGDTHGCIKTLDKLVNGKIGLGKTDILVMLGDYIDRGPSAREVLDFLVDLKKKGFSIITLKGNHEEMMQLAFEDDNLQNAWYLNGGATTINSFANIPREIINDVYVGFIKSMPYYHSVGPFLFVHAGFNELADDPFSDTHEMTWECHSVYNTSFFREKVVVHGHRPKKMEVVLEALAKNARVIPLDTGCVYKNNSDLGILSALDLDSMTLFTTENID